MEKTKLRAYSIMRLIPDHHEEICLDIKEQIEKGITDMPLFSMTLSPEGDPLFDKAEILCERYKPFRDRLRELGIPSGILVQASIGHGGIPNYPSALQTYTGIADGVVTSTICPYDPAFIDYIRDALRTIASYQPATVMIDDDFRLLARPGKGCACPLHMAEFNRRAGTRLTREELYAEICAESELGKRYRDIFIETQRDSLLNAARAMREGIDSIDPTLRASFCICGNASEFGAEIIDILAGEGNEKEIRLNNGRYTAQGARNFSHVFFRAAIQRTSLGDIDCKILAETDTCPQNRYSTSAHSLHSHYTASILEGATGAKHWITRAAYEPSSGVAYRKILAEHKGFYQALADLYPTLRPVGCRSPLSTRPAHDLMSPTLGESFHGDSWTSLILERLGIPFYYSTEQGGAVILSGSYVDRFTDEELHDMLKGPILLDAPAAKRLINRGFGELLGVEVREWGLANPSTELIHANGVTCSVPRDPVELVPLSDRVRTASTIMHLRFGGRESVPIAPGTTVFENSEGGTVAVFAGSVNAPYKLGPIFSFLSESRKLELIDLLKSVDRLPVCYTGDAEVCLRAADMADGGLFAAFFNIGLDPLDDLALYVKNGIRRVERLAPDGHRATCDFTQTGDRTFTVDTPAGILDPVILFIY